MLERGGNVMLFLFEEGWKISVLLQYSALGVSPGVSLDPCYRAGTYYKARFTRRKLKPSRVDNFTGL